METICVSLNRDFFMALFQFISILNCLRNEEAYMARCFFLSQLLQTLWGSSDPNSDADVLHCILEDPLPNSLDKITGSLSSLCFYALF